MKKYLFFSLALLGASLLFTSPLFALQKGDRVKCRFKGKGNYYPGVVFTVSDDQATIHYDDGDKETIPQTACFVLEKTSSSGGDNLLSKISSNSSRGWEKWSIFAGGQKGSLIAKDKGFVWNMDLNGTRIKIDTCIEWKEKWMKWKYYYNGNQIIIEADSRGYWKIDGVYKRLKVKTRWSNNYDSWEVTGKTGSMKIKSEGRSFKSWIIEDKMSGEDIHMKLAALFAIIYASDVMK